MQRLIIATHNKHKTEEIRQILKGHFKEITDLTTTKIEPAVEDGTTFEANATIKALHACRYLKDAYVLADDSGLEADGLDGDPGVFSARYAGENATDTENRLKLLRILGKNRVRTARFRCLMVLARNQRVIHVSGGKVEGRITYKEHGEGGFGYDSIFIPDGYDETFGELSSDIKNTISHRANALELLVHFLSRTEIHDDI